MDPAASAGPRDVVLDVLDALPEPRKVALRGCSRWSAESAVFLAALVDFMCLALAVLSVGWLIPDGMGRLASSPAVTSAFSAVLVALVLDYRNQYELSALLHPVEAIPSILLAVLVAAACLLVPGWAGKGELAYAPSWVALFSLLAVAVLAAGRFVSATLLVHAARRGLFTRNVIVIGAGPSAQRLLAKVAQERRPWTRILAVFDDRAKKDPMGRVARQVEGIPVRGTVARALTFARRVRVDDIVVALPWSAADRIRCIVRAAERLSANVHLAPDSLDFVAQEQGLTVRDGVPALRVSRKPLAGWNYTLKRAMDLSIAGVALLLLSPLLLLVAIAIRLESRGPVLFRQARYGINNRTIHIYKFRSMYHDQQDVRADRLVSRDDPRVTPIGRFIRRTSIDELPQLFNVLRGDMSIVGPRPHAMNAKAAGRKYQEVVQEYAHRHRIKPGITGWAQVNGWRGETDTEEKILRRCEHDLYYIDHWSLWLDIRIVLATLLAPFHRNAF